MVTWPAGEPRAVKDNGTGPGKKNLIDFRFSEVRLGVLYGTRQKKLSKGCTEAAKLRKESCAAEKTAHEAWRRE